MSFDGVSSGFWSKQPSDKDTNLLVPSVIRIVNQCIRYLRQIFRGLIRNPAFTLITISTLALGIGSTSAVLNLIEGVLLTPPPYANPDEILLLSTARVDGHPYSQGCTKTQWLGWREQAKSLSAVSGYNWGFDFLILPDGSESLEGMWVTPELFNLLGIKPLLGRTFLASEASAKPDPVILLGYEVWQRRFNGDRNIVGRVLKFSRRPPQTVVGVMPPGLRFLPSARNATEPNYDLNATVDFWAPASPDETAPKQTIWSVVGRLREGATARAAQVELTTIAARQALADHDFDGLTAVAQPLAAELNREGNHLLIPMLGAVSLVFLIACANVAGLLLTRGLQRQGEYAVRCALGAQRSRLFLRAISETLTLGFLGTVLGVFLAWGTVQLLKAMGGHAIPRSEMVKLGWPMLILSGGLGTLAVFIAGLAPAIRVSLFDPITAIKSGGPNSSPGWRERQFLAGVVVIQTALTMALLVSAGLLVQTVRHIASVRPGFDTQSILTMSVTVPTTDQVRIRDFHLRALERISKMPSVQRVSFAWGVPLTGNKWTQSLALDGQSDAQKFKDKILVAAKSVTPEFFETIGIRILDGRTFSPPEVKDDSFVVMINQAFANRYFAGQNPIGKKVIFPNIQNARAEIIGLVADARSESVTSEAEPEIYVSYWGSPPFTKHLVIRAANPSGLKSAVQKELRAIDPTVAIEAVKTMEQIRQESIAPRIFAMRLLTGFSVIGCVLALIGIYGLLSHSVACRRREIAIRAALGSPRSLIMRLVLLDAVAWIVLGLVLGSAAAIALARVLQTLLFEVRSYDPATMIAMAGLFVVAALVASWAPARRAAGVEPVEVLRER